MPAPCPSGPMRRGAPVVKPKDMKGTLRRLWELTKGHRKGLTWMLLLSALASVSAMLSPLIIGNAVNAIDAGNPAVWILLLLLALYLTDWLVRFLQQFFMASIGQHIILHIRKTLFSSPWKSSPSPFLTNGSTGELMSRLTNDVDNISTTISDSLSQLMIYGFTILGVFFIMLYENVILTGVALISVFLVLILTKTITRHTRTLLRSSKRSSASSTGRWRKAYPG